MEHYRIDHTKKIIRAIIEKLTDAEVDVIVKYQKLGYELKNVKGFETKEERKSKKEAAENSPFSQKNVIEFLKGQDEKHTAKYWELFNKPATDSETGEIKRYKKDKKDENGKVIKEKGDIIVKGHVATLSWFKKTFPKYGTK